MGFFHKKPDPISARSKELTREIAQLEQKIQKLHVQLESPPDARERPKLRSTAMPHTATAVPPVLPTLVAAAQEEALFEPVDQNRLKSGSPGPGFPPPAPDLGTRKRSLGALFRRWQQHLRGAPASNPKLFKYLAAGNIHGLRPMRYEKRVLRNRLIVLVVLLLAVLYGLFKILFWK